MDALEHIDAIAKLPAGSRLVARAPLKVVPSAGGTITLPEGARLRVSAAMSVIVFADADMGDGGTKHVSFDVDEFSKVKVAE